MSATDSQIKTISRRLKLYHADYADYADYAEKISIKCHKFTD